ncbi:MAG: GH3 auxin-responsive promoter family protein, partial [Ginsengibacter sp.]
MKIKSFLAKPFATYINKQIRKSMQTAVPDQEHIFQALIKNASKTEFGKQHHFDKIKNHNDFVKAVPIRDYEDFKIYIDKIKDGKHNILWKGVPIYFAKTSGTTSGIKYIPI